MADRRRTGAITGAVILGRLGDATRFQSLAAVRAFSGLVPALDASGVSARPGGPTKRGDALLREALFISANQARRLDPTLAATYHRLMVHAGKHKTLESYRYHVERIWIPAVGKEEDPGAGCRPDRGDASSGP